MYKDKDKQREANRLAKVRQRAKQGMTSGGMTQQGMTAHPDDVHVPDAEFTRLLAQAKPGHVRVSKPGDDDYVPQCETTRRFIDGRRGAACQST